jgi:hypothetical protein
MANRADTTNSPRRLDDIRLSDMFRDPVLRAFFERSERDNGSAIAIPVPRSPRSPAGAGRQLVEA